MRRELYLHLARELLEYFAVADERLEFTWPDPKAVIGGSKST